MSNASVSLPPLSLYIHLPWCVAKCPYCDFNSHVVKHTLPEEMYIRALLEDYQHHLHMLHHRPLISIFFGGGTPSLFSPQSIAYLLNEIAKKTKWVTNIEITLEANPGTTDQAKFVGLRAAGINRLSLGIQSFQAEKLTRLGRIHNQVQAKQAIIVAKKAGFHHLNLDLMYGLPDQSIDEGLADIKTALDFAPSHLSWYQLTLEPNTLFFHQPPPLPTDNAIWELQERGQALIKAAGLHQYEVSAYAKDKLACRHNRHYWEFGDYLGIGAGAHSKLTDTTGKIYRFAQVKHPKDYLNAAMRTKQMLRPLNDQDLIIEFMLNALRLTQGVPLILFEQRTGLDSKRILPIINKAIACGLLEANADMLIPTTLGKRFLNDLIAMFL